MGIPMLKIRRSRDRLIFNMGIPILVRRHLCTETVPWSSPLCSCHICTHFMSLIHNFTWIHCMNILFSIMSSSISCQRQHLLNATTYIMIDLFLYDRLKQIGWKYPCVEKGNMVLHKITSTSLCHEEKNYINMLLYDIPGYDWLF